MPYVTLQLICRWPLHPRPPHRLPPAASTAPDTPALQALGRQPSSLPLLPRLHPPLAPPAPFALPPAPRLRRSPRLCLEITTSKTMTCARSRTISRALFHVISRALFDADHTVVREEDRVVPPPPPALVWVSRA
jgi:hypothetical protein